MSIFKHKTVFLLLSVLCISCSNEKNGQSSSKQNNVITDSKNDHFDKENCNYKVMMIVAHQDDDIWFASPEIKRHLAAGACINTIYTTNGKPAKNTFQYALSRIHGIVTSYSFLDNESKPSYTAWAESTRNVLTHKPLFFSNSKGTIVKTFLGIDDPWLGNGWGSNTQISQMEDDPTFKANAYPDLRNLEDIDQIALYAIKSKETYTRANTVEVLATLIQNYKPSFIYAQDSTITKPYTEQQWDSGEGFDHPSHIATAKLVDSAVASIQNPTFKLINFTNYPVAGRAINLNEQQTETHKNVMFWYGPYDNFANINNCTQTETGVQPICKIGSAESKWLGKTYFTKDYTAAPDAIVISTTSSGFKLGDILSTYIGESQTNIYNGNTGAYRDMSLNIKNITSGENFSVAGNFIGSPTIVAGGDNRISTFAQTSDGFITYLSSKANGEWYKPITWNDSIITSSPVSIANKDGRLAVLAIDKDGNLLYRAEKSIGSTWDSKWIKTGVTDLSPSSLSTALDNSGRIIISAVTLKGEAVLAWQSSSGHVTFNSISTPLKNVKEVSMLFSQNTLHISGVDASSKAISETSIFIPYSIETELAWNPINLISAASLNMTNHQMFFNNGVLAVTGLCQNQNTSCYVNSDRPNFSYSFNNGGSGKVKVIIQPSQIPSKHYILGRNLSDKIVINKI